MKFLNRHWCIGLLVILASTFSQAGQMAVVVHKSNSTTDMNAADLAKIFKLDSHKWPDGRNVVIVLRRPSTQEMQQILQKLCKLRPEEVKVFLATRHSGVVFVNSEEELLKSVSSTPGAVGLVDVYSITNHVNVLKVDGKLPLEQGYLLRGN